MHGISALRFKIARRCRATSWFWLAELIRDVRKDLATPRMPFVIGVLVVDGLNAKGNTVAFPYGNGCRADDTTSSG